MELHNIDLNLPIVDPNTGLATEHFKDWIRIAKKEKANRVEGATADNIATLTSEGHPQDGERALPDSDIVGLTDLQKLENKTFAELITQKILSSDGSGGIDEIDLADWIDVDSTLTKTDNGDGTLTIVVKIKDGYGIDSDTDGLKLKQQSNITDASESHSVTGTDTVNQSNLESALNALGVKINEILDLILATELMAAP